MYDCFVDSLTWCNICVLDIHNHENNENKYYNEISIFLATMLIKIQLFSKDLLNSKLCITLTFRFDFAFCMKNTSPQRVNIF